MKKQILIASTNPVKLNVDKNAFQLLIPESRFNGIHLTFHQAAVTS
ncbi:MAG: hypothetical protein RBT01_10670 [Anaerolineaceae bacterium]|jgi:non-canonical (house-cleaning) NTP pyrophosphatase|nr:hypothetical protein [Anaerolineaceae bacterium]